MTAPDADRSGVELTRGGLALLQAARAVLLLLAAVALVGAVGSAGVPSDDRTLLARAQAGDVAVLQVDGPSLPASLLALGSDQPASGVTGWVDRWGVRSSLSGSSLQPGADLVATVLAAAPPDDPPRVVRGPLLRDHLASVGPPLTMLLLLLLLLGPQPRRLTKWGWTWVLVGVPGSLGALLHLTREDPWSRRTAGEATLPAGVAVRGHRSSGGTALACVVVVNLALFLLVLLALELLPQSAELQPAPFSVVLLDGTRVPGG